MPDVTVEWHLSGFELCVVAALAINWMWLFLIDRHLTALCNYLGDLTRVYRKLLEKQSDDA